MIPPNLVAARSAAFSIENKAASLRDLAAILRAEGYPVLSNDVLRASDFLLKGASAIREGMPPCLYFDAEGERVRPNSPNVRPPAAWRVRPRLMAGVMRYQVIAERGRVVSHHGTADEATAWINEQRNAT